MRKKRKVWWIVGGVLCFFVLSVFAMLLLQANSADAKLEATLDEVINKYGLKLDPEDQGDASGTGLSIEVYSTERLTLVEAQDISKAIGDACENCRMEPASGNPAESGLTTIITGDEYDSISIIHVIRIEDGTDAVTFHEISDGIVIVRSTPSLWERVKSLWPW